MARRSFEQVTAQVIAVERLALMRFAAVHREQVRALVASGEVAADEAELLNDRIKCFVDQVATGLHTGGDAPATRKEVRRVLGLARLLPGGAR